MSFSKQDLRTIHASLTRLLPPAPSLPRTPEEVVEIGRVRDVVALAIQQQMHTVERGALVFQWRLPRERAPRLNQLGYMKAWMLKRLKQELDDEVRAMLPAWPDADMHGARVKRWVRATRFSRNKVDELSVDVLGGKLPIDSLVRVGVLADDSQELLVREALCRSTSHGNTHLLIEVFAVADQAVPCGEPEDAPVQQVVRKKGALTRAIVKKVVRKKGALTRAIVKKKRASKA